MTCTPIVTSATSNTYYDVGDDAFYKGTIFGSRIRTGSPAIGQNNCSVTLRLKRTSASAIVGNATAGVTDLSSTSITDSIGTYDLSALAQNVETDVQILGASGSSMSLDDIIGMSFPADAYDKLQVMMQNGAGSTDYSMAYYAPSTPAWTEPSGFLNRGSIGYGSGSPPGTHTSRLPPPPIVVHF